MSSDSSKPRKSVTVILTQLECRVAANWLESALNGADKSRRAQAVARVVKKLDTAICGGIERKRP